MQARCPRRRIMKHSNFTEKKIYRVNSGGAISFEGDAVACEEPLEIRLSFVENGKAAHKSVSITMRTPGDDLELAAGFLFTEGIVKSAEQISRIKHCGTKAKINFYDNTVRVDLRAGVEIDFKKLERHFYTSSSCGVCGKTSIEALQTGVCSLKNTSSAIFSSDIIHRLPEILRARQNVFEKTGGLHAAALFSQKGELEILREDVGRHNAVDKLIGAKFLRGETPVGDKLLLVSGRASFELVQKALMAGIPILAAIGAPSSLAVELANEYEMTLLGFVRDNRFNIYSGAERIAETKTATARENNAAGFEKAKNAILDAR